VRGGRGRSVVLKFIIAIAWALEDDQRQGFMNFVAIQEGSQYEEWLWVYKYNVLLGFHDKFELYASYVLLHMVIVLICI